MSVLQESPAWPVLVECCAARGVRLGLLNARMSSRAFLSWFQPRVSRALLRRMLSDFSLIVPQSDIVSLCVCMVFGKQLGGKQCVPVRL
jgi:3-deoxy-D-manno-octulosonic-acid transferase